MAGIISIPVNSCAIRTPAITTTEQKKKCWFIDKLCNEHHDLVFYANQLESRMIHIPKKNKPKLLTSALQSEQEYKKYTHIHFGLRLESNLGKIDFSHKRAQFIERIPLTIDTRHCKCAWIRRKRLLYSLMSFLFVFFSEIWRFFFGKDSYVSVQTNWRWMCVLIDLT